MLTLPIKRMWFDMIASGEKKKEYRAIKEYSKAAPQVKAMCTLSIGTGKPEWGAEPGKKYTSKK